MRSIGPTGNSSLPEPTSRRPGIRASSRMAVRSCNRVGKASPEGNVVSPILVGGANWQNPSYDPVHSVMYVVALNGGMGYRSVPVKYEAGRQYMGGTPFPGGESSKMGLLAIDAKTGSVMWEYPTFRVSMGAGVLATGSGLVFLATGDGNLIALEAKTGKSLWHFQDGRQHRFLAHQLRSRRKAVRRDFRWKCGLQLCPS